MIASLSDLLRMSLRSVGVQEVELREEIDFLQRYLEIMSLRFGDGMRAGKVQVTVAPDGDMLRCEVVDNGRGFPAGGSREGVGISNTRARLRHLYGERFSLELMANPGGGARVSLAIPYHS